jgi:hypothetical protein
MKTTFRFGAFEAASLFVIALTALWLAGLTAFAAAHHAGLL